MNEWTLIKLMDFDESAEMYFTFVFSLYLHTVNIYRPFSRVAERKGHEKGWTEMH